MESSQNVSHYNAEQFFWFFFFKEWILVGQSQTRGTLLVSHGAKANV